MSDQVVADARSGYGDDYGGGGGGGGGYGYMSSYVDPYLILASLGFGTFLFNIIYDLLNRSARSTDVFDLNVPLEMSDQPDVFQSLDTKDWDELSSGGTGDDADHSRLGDFLRKGRRMAAALRLRPAQCSQHFLCHISNDPIAWNSQPSIALRALQLYVVSLAHHFGAENAARYVDQLESRPPAQCPLLDDDSPCKDVLIFD